MENMCNDSTLNGVINVKNHEKQNQFTFERSLRHSTPGTVSSVENVRSILSPDDDFPSYQIPRVSKRYSDFSEEQDSLLPVSPVCTPPSINKSEDIKEPLIHTIGTIVKKYGEAKPSINEEMMDVQLEVTNKLIPNIFDELGMLDKDISWNSSMETPAPHPLSLNDYNTIERATLLPENDMKSMQPRALFSPYKDEEIEFIPLKYSSESDGGKDSPCQMLGDCETLKERTTSEKWGDNGTLVESPKQRLSPSLNSGKNTETEREMIMSPCSPIFRIRKRKKRTKFKKTRVLLVKSPVIPKSSVDEYEDERKTPCDLDFSSAFNENEMNTCNENKERCSFFIEKSNAIQDDSFQDMSFSYIDEICKNATCLSGSSTISTSLLRQENITENSETSKVKKLSLNNGKINLNKVFYESTEKSDELRPVPSSDAFLKSAKRLEEGSNLPGKEVNELFTNGEFIVFNKMVKEVSDSDFSVLGMKKIRSENYPEKSTRMFCEKKAIKLDNDREEKNSTLVDCKETNCDALQDISSHFDANDSQICLTAAFAESLINQSEFTGNNIIKNESQGTNNKEVGNNNKSPADKVRCDLGFIKENFTNRKDNFLMFSTALGNSISVSNDAILKAQNILKENYEESDLIESELSKTEESTERDILVRFEGFKTASGLTVKINEKSLRKAKGLLKELIEEEDPMRMPVLEDIGFATASGKKLKISEESLNKARSILSTVDMKFESDKEEDKLKKINDEQILESRVQLGPVAFRTASNKKVEVSEDSLRNIQTLWKGEEEIMEEYFGNLEEQKVVSESVINDGPIIEDEKDEFAKVSVSVEPTQKFYGFNTASGKNVSVSNQALSKAKKILGEVEEESIHKITTSKTVEEIRNFGNEMRMRLPDGTSEKQKVTDDEEDFEELIPEWLHAYNTSPTFTMDRSHVSAVTSHEDCQQYSTPREQYIVKSPILGTTDRFYNKRKRRNPGRKLIFEPSPKLELHLKPNLNVSNEKNFSKRYASDMNVDFSVPFKRRKLNIDVYDIRREEVGKLSEEIKEKRRLARLDQVKAGKKGKVKPVPGSHILKKKKPQMSWYEAVQGALPEKYSKEILFKYGIREDVLEITASNAADYKFKSTDFFTSADSFTNVNGFPVGDGCLLIFDDENMAGFEDFARAFFASPGVEPNLVSIEWIKNHYKWIVWKFSHYERAFPQIFGCNCLTPHNVLVQLKYRYDLEIDRSQRSSLKRILERDDTSAKKMVLCVSDIKKMSNLDSNVKDLLLNKSLISYKLGLSDGWYSCYAQTDSAMARLIEEGKVSIGTKLVIQGAELLNCDKGISPLEAGENIHLKISTNSTRRARWDVKLGFQKNGSSLLVPLNSILPNGGLISRIDVIITRIYPILHIEKKPDGTNVIRNSRMEDKAAAAYQQQQEAIIEKIYQVVKDELRNKEKEKEKRIVKLSMLNISEVVDAEELYRYYENYSDPTSFQSLLTSKQKEILIEHQRRKSEINHKELSDLVQKRIKAEKMNSRKVSQLLKIRIVDLHKPNYANPALFTVWNSMEDVSRIFSEGKAISIFNATPGNSRFFNTIQLNSTRQTRYKELSQCVDYPARKVTSLSELTSEFESIFNEIDIVGIVVASYETSFGSKLTQTIYIADEDLNFAGIVFWGHCKDFGWENILTVTSIVACSNLQWSKKKNSNSIPSVYANDTSIFTENPKQNYFKEEIKRLKTSLPEDKKSFISKCAEEITAKLEDCKQNSNISKNSSIHNDSSLNSSTNLKPKYINGFKTKPNASSTPLKTISLGLDNSEQDPSPIQKKIEKLQIYGEPPPLSPLLPVDNLEKFRSKFRVPFKNTCSSYSTPK